MVYVVFCRASQDNAEAMEIKDHQEDRETQELKDNQDHREQGGHR